MWTEPLRIGNYFKPQIAVRSDGYFALTAQINGTGIYRQLFNAGGQAVTGMDLLIPTKEGQSFAGHWTCYISDTLNVLYSQESPYRALLHTEIDNSGVQSIATNVGAALSSAFFNENYICSDEGDLYFALMSYQQDGSKRINIYKNWQLVGNFDGQASPRIAASNGNWFCYARKEPGVCDFNYFSNRLSHNSGEFSATVNVNGGMAVSVNGDKVLCAFGRKEVRLFQYDFATGALSEFPSLATADVAGNGIAAYPVQSSFEVAWQDKAGTLALNATDNFTKVNYIWLLGGDANTTLEVAGAANKHMACFAGVSGSDRKLYVSFKQVANKEIVKMTKPLEYTPIEPIRILADKVLNADETITIDARASGLPIEALALSLHVSVVNNNIGGYLTMWASGTPDPKTATVNFWAMQRGAAGDPIVTLSDGKFNIRCGAGSAKIYIDVAGYLA
jgi:hypothetical protein